MPYCFEFGHALAINNVGNAKERNTSSRTAQGQLLITFARFVIQLFYCTIEMYFGTVIWQVLKNPVKST